MRYLVEALGASVGSVVGDVGAGTGKLTRELVRTGARVVAVEPIDAMRSVLASAVPEADIVGSTAEELPFADATLHAITVAQAFHWLDGDRALTEFARVLRAGGGLALVWNARDERVAWCRRLTAVLDERSGDTPRYRDGVWRRAFDRSTAFEPIEHRSFDHEQPLSHDVFLDRVGSISFVAAAPAADRRRILQTVEELLRTDPDLAGRDPVAFPYRTDVFTTRRR